MLVASAIAIAMSALTTRSRLSARSARPWGMVPSRIQPISASSISTTRTSSTRWSARTRSRVKPSPSPPTTTRRGRSTSSRAAPASSASVEVLRLSMTKTPLTRSSSVSAACSSMRRRSTTSPRSDSARATSTYSVIGGESVERQRPFHTGAASRRTRGSPPGCPPSRRACRRWRSSLRWVTWSMASWKGAPSAARADLLDGGEDERRTRLEQPRDLPHAWPSGRRGRAAPR